MFKGLVFKNYYYLSLILNVVLIISILIFRNLIPPVVPLFYGAAAGEDQLVVALALTVAPCVSLIVTIGNMFLSQTVKDEFLSKILAISSLLVTGLIMVTVIKIFFLVGYF